MSGSLAGAALDMQSRMLRFTRSDLGQRFSRAMSSVENEAKEKAGLKASDDLGRIIQDGQVRILAGGETFAVTSEIADLVQSSALTMPDFQVQERDMPCPVGFIMLEEGLLFRDDAANRPVVVKALGLDRRGDGTNRHG